MDITGDAIQTKTDNKDFYFIVIQKNASKLLYASFFGQFGGMGDHVDGGTSRFDSRGSIYMSICANCGGNYTCRGEFKKNTDPLRDILLITPEAIGPRNGAAPIYGCNLAAVKINFSFDGVENGIKSAIDGVYDTSGCSPLRVKFYDTIAMAQKYIWDFGDGTPTETSTSPEIEHDYTVSTESLFNVRLISIDDNRCITRDTSYMKVKVGINAVDLKAEAERIGPCTSSKFKLINRSTFLPGSSFNAKSFVWIYDDKTPPDTTDLGEVQHDFTPGLHRVWLKLLDFRYCNQSDSIPLDIFVFSTINAEFDISKDTICAGQEITIKNKSTGGTSFSWTFDNGKNSNIYSPADQKYQLPGDKLITLIVSENSPGCSITKQYSKKLYVQQLPYVEFDYSPKPSVENTPFSFINKSKDAVKYLWNFGDGNTSSLFEPLHQYLKQAKFNVILTATNKFGCSDNFKLPVQPVITELLQIPNAFSPNGDGQNDIFYPKIFGIDNMNLKIFNRFGQLIFESYNPNFGWDGKFKGIPQPIDVYAYTLIVEFADGRRESRKGSITLIR